MLESKERRARCAEYVARAQMLRKLVVSSLIVADCESPYYTTLDTPSRPTMHLFREARKKKGKRKLTLAELILAVALPPAITFNEFSASSRKQLRGALLPSAQRKDDDDDDDDDDNDDDDDDDDDDEKKFLNVVWTFVNENR
ncbi:hypothetical protein K0M31_008326 [Melipona bicolor]|uniref:Uncharacterized protein n=1 Tax=Melipona bicolor TaxID=60889 RepID=A0AA40FQS1_9HYME|nr:hypothetical protein K0M31_008326 [Melipona bicolor]